MPLAEVYCSISKNFRIMYTNEIGGSSVEATPACGGAEVGEIGIFPVPCGLEG